MQTQSDTEYFLERAKAERISALKAKNADLARLHEELADGFEALARQRAGDPEHG